MHGAEIDVRFELTGKDQDTFLNEIRSSLAVLPGTNITIGQPIAATCKVALPLATIAKSASEAASLTESVVYLHLNPRICIDFKISFPFSDIRA